nr:hypothetical protein [Shewanella electrodiphila]
MKGIIEKKLPNGFSINHFIENKHGVIYTVKSEQSHYDKIYGGNVYDGAFSVDLVDNVNGIDRAFLLTLLHKKPKNILVIGLSSGSWLRVVASIPGVKNIDVVEINDAYKELISRYEGYEILSDKRINYFTGDGRQFVSNASKQKIKYDLIVINTTWHWRAYTTNLLSIDFFKIVKSIMSEEAVFAFNSTYSIDVVHTVKKVFDYTYLRRNFVYSSFIDINESLGSKVNRICSLIAEGIDDQHCGNLDFKHMADTLNTPFSESLSDKFNTERMPELVTDDNMIVEYKYGKGFSL